MTNKKISNAVMSCLDDCLAKHKGRFGNPCLSCVDKLVREQVEIDREVIAQIVTDCIRSEIPFVDVPAIIRARTKGGAGQ